MSQSNKCNTNLLNNHSVNFVKYELELNKQCLKRSCKGTCVEVLVSYSDQGPINHEYECTTCGKVIKDPQFRKERENHWYRDKLKEDSKKRKKRGDWF